MQIIGFNLSPLPDFLEDHTMLGQEPNSRIQEHCRRWVQFIRSLSKWRDYSDGSHLDDRTATFCLRFRGEKGKVSAALLARPRDPRLAQELQRDLETLLAAYRILQSPETCRCDPADIERLGLLANPVGWMVSQHLSYHTWSPEGDGRGASHSPGVLRTKPAVDAKVLYGWWGPGGPFLLPMESLARQEHAVTLSVYIEPTSLIAPIEVNYLRDLASLAASQEEQQSAVFKGDHTVRRADPSAALAGRLYLANFRRLLANPFQVVVHCAAADGDQVAARNLVGTLHGVVNEAPFEPADPDERSLPAGTDMQPFDQAATAQYESLAFPGITFPEVKEMKRLPFLVDANGAATLFRLPVSVRGGVPGLEVRQLPPDFNPGPRLEIQQAKMSLTQFGLPAPNIILGRLHQGGWASVPADDFTKHALVTGFTGSGKSQTIWFLLQQFWSMSPEMVADTDPKTGEKVGLRPKRSPQRGPNGGGVPFLVIESAKQEYRGFLGVPEIAKDLLVYTLGNETCAPFRLNPFELLEGVRVEAHISRLQTCFEGALPNVGPMQSVIIESLVRLYDDPVWDLDRRWKLTEYYHQEDLRARRFPTMTEFYNVAETVIRERRYVGDIQSNVQAAILGRIKPLTTKVPTSVSRMLDTRESTCFDTIFTQPTILELNDLNEQDKALTMMFLLTMLREYREAHARPYLQHITVVEEAHNVLSQVVSQQGNENASDSRFRAVQSFCQMLTEIRALGEGLIIADQSPEKLAADAMRNTNVQIAHQLRDSTDREAVARALLMTDEQRDYVGKLRPGYAAVFYTGLERATFVKVPNYRDKDTMEALGFSPGDKFGQYAQNDVPALIRGHMKQQNLIDPTPELPFGELCGKCDESLGCGYRKKLYRIFSPGNFLSGVRPATLKRYGQAVRDQNRVKANLKTAQGAALTEAVSEDERLRKEEFPTAKDELHAELRRRALEVAKACGDEAGLGLARCAFLHLCYAAGTPGTRELPNRAYWESFRLSLPNP